VLLVLGRELNAYRRSPVGTAIVAAALLVEGIGFYIFGLSREGIRSADVLDWYLYIASGIRVVAALMLSIRLVAEERQTGSITLLNTTPIRPWEIVLGKYLAAATVLLILTVLSAYMPGMIFIHGKVSVGHILVGYLGVLLLGGAALAVGTFTSSLVRSQLLALILAAVIVGPLLVLWFIAKATDEPIASFLAALSLHNENFRPFERGRLELGGVVFYLVFTYFFLLASTKILEARRWR
jgi:ABC-2 type transport system permease protein